MQLAAEKAGTKELRDSRLGSADTTDVTVLIATSSRHEAGRSWAPLPPPNPCCPPLYSTQNGQGLPGSSRELNKLAQGVRVPGGFELELVCWNMADTVVWLTHGRFPACPS